MAYEIGHFQLHKGDVYLDGRARFNFRDGLSSMATDRKEIEANTFAAALLTPATCIRSAFETAVRSDTINSGDELVELLGARYAADRARSAPVRRANARMPRPLGRGILNRLLEREIGFHGQ